MEPPATDPVATAIAFANGLRRNVTVAGRNWAQWPGGADHLVAVAACIDTIRQRLQTEGAGEGNAAVGAAIVELRAILEWTLYQSASIATARALLFARKTRAFADRFGLLDDTATGLSVLVDSERSLIDSVGTRNGFMVALAARHPHIELPAPLVDVWSLAAQEKKPPGRLAFIQRLRKISKENPV